MLTMRSRIAAWGHFDLIERTAPARVHGDQNNVLAQLKLDLI